MGEGPKTGTNPVVTPIIDPFVWDDGGARTLVWGSFNGIYAVPLSADGGGEGAPGRHPP